MQLSPLTVQPLLPKVLFLHAPMPTTVCFARVTGGRRWETRNLFALVKMPLRNKRYCKEIREFFLYIKYLDKELRAP